MSFPNSGLGPFEGENKDWAAHLARNFSREVTQPALKEHDPAQLALAHLIGFITCAMFDAGGRGDGKQQIMPDLLHEAVGRLGPLFAGTIGVSILEDARPIFTVVPGGKEKPRSA
ncbi:MAG: hypothetical protein EOS54_11790 [Mesorhizobium sp.]|uniref:hypothetical protein n=1 Tax=Mesorhizobium sp. TaxID=1871066 RepID=UPI000FE84BF2|nr:hypothetical protein [Mesorhizobium sp.]RWC53856.1 MAG: hypothetical protein EOS54_11790 [Mesorhizobium sp.]TIV83158.1 MAG: hypothetical protein E5V64_09215 [Mesorhizobium sp.]TIX16670.1 MAG: hypothetical protein E5V46_01855 [Mesorhizobium sp.]